MSLNDDIASICGKLDGTARNRNGIRLGLLELLKHGPSNQPIRTGHYNCFYLINRHIYPSWHGLYMYEDLAVIESGLACILEWASKPSNKYKA